MLIRLGWYCVVLGPNTWFSAVIGPKLDPSFQAPEGLFSCSHSAKIACTSSKVICWNQRNTSSGVNGEVPVVSRLERVPRTTEERTARNSLRDVKWSIAKLDSVFAKFKVSNHYRLQSLTSLAQGNQLRWISSGGSLNWEESSGRPQAHAPHHLAQQCALADETKIPRRSAFHPS